VPPCTSSGRIFRFRDKGVPTQDGLLTDFYVEAVLVTPDSLDEESQSLIRAFAERNGEDPREKE
jgi:DnaJ-class molecular chaperone